MSLYAAALVYLTMVSSLTEVRTCAALLGLAGGIITVIFFAIWPHMLLGDVIWTDTRLGTNVDRIRVGGRTARDRDGPRALGDPSLPCSMV